MKDKRIKRKIGKRKISEDKNISDSDEMKIDIENSQITKISSKNNISNYSLPQNNSILSLNIPNIPNANFSTLEIINRLDFKNSASYFLEGSKGHSNYISIQQIKNGTFYLEVKIKSLDFSISDWINQKKTDEFSKKYYENISANPIGFSPNIRIGLSHEKSDLEIPVGSDMKSYCYRARDGAIITEGEIKRINVPCENNDVIGVLIKMKPPMPEFLKEKILEKGEKSLLNSDCYVKFFINGKEVENNFFAISEGDYYIVITLYNYSKAEIDFGNNLEFFFSLPNSVNAVPFKEMN